jgi:hypothetical protein
MSVHTLHEDPNTGMVQIAADITKAEALKAGPQILKFCHEINDKPMPLLIQRAPLRPRQGPLTTSLGAIGNDSEHVTVEITCGSCGGEMTFRMDPDRADQIASHLATRADLARTGVDPREAAELAAWLDESMDASPEELAVMLLRRFEVKERQP